jgi:hypothetical protein
MKTLAEQVNLKRELIKISASELRKRPGDVIAQVGFGKTFLLTHCGKPVAVLSKPPGETLSIKVSPKGETSYILA